MAKNTEDMLSKIDTKLDEAVEAIHKVDKDVALQKASLEERTNDVNRMYEELKRMNDILQQNTESLREHMHRTDLLEQLALNLNQRLEPIELEKIEQETIKKYRTEQLKKYGKIVGIVATAIGILAAIKPYLLKLLAL